MLFYGLAGDGRHAKVECALIAVYGKDDAALLFQHTIEFPAEIAQQIAILRPGSRAELAHLGQLHTSIGRWIGSIALAALAKAGVTPQSIELTGCRPIQITGGLALGDLGIAGIVSGLAIIALPEGVGGERCARAAWQIWQETRKVPGAEVNARSVTEGRNPATMEIDLLPTLDMLRLINREDGIIARVVGGQLPQIAEAVDRVAERMQQGGRMIYAGAGTSGRIGVLDASEMPPTYGTSRDLVVALIAGGETAIQHSVEGIEDNAAAGAQAIRELQVSEKDSVVGIAASGRTPFVIGAMEEARRRGALTISLACNSPAPMEERADIIIAPVVGPEVITGSTRMKAGTAQKMTLNMLSTGVMVRLGKTFSNLMVSMQTSNSKLKRRARLIVAQACGISEEEAGQVLDEAGGEVKTAIVTVIADVSPAEARTRLAQNGGIVRKACEAKTGK